MFHVPEKHRIRQGGMGSNLTYGNNGAFFIDRGRTQIYLIASDMQGWEHVSVHCVSERKERTPTWAEMCLVKNLFWDEEDCVVQFHPIKSQYVNLHQHTLHLWRPTEAEIPTPDKNLVGY